MTEPNRGGRARPFAARRVGSVLHLTGDIDQTNWREVADSVASDLRAGAVEVDLSRVGFFGAAGVRALLNARAVSPSARPLRVTCTPRVFRVLGISGLENLDGLAVTQIAARQDLSPRAGA